MPWKDVTVLRKKLRIKRTRSDSSNTQRLEIGKGGKRKRENKVVKANEEEGTSSDNDSMKNNEGGKSVTKGSNVKGAKADTAAKRRKSVNSKVPQNQLPLNFTNPCYKPLLCAICQKKFLNNNRNTLKTRCYETECNHDFHVMCFKELQTNKCPVCRSKVLQIR
jgi:hypothetical protein